MPKARNKTQEQKVSLRPATRNYVYRPLNEAKKQVRILVLAPGSFSDETVRGSLVHISLNTLRRQTWPWYALSYVWGTSDRDEAIRISRANIYITQSLLSALRYHRLPDSECYLWIDQICINQDDIVERGSQVQLMQKIYAEATLVVAWLGTATTEIEELLSMMKLAGLTIEKSLSSYHNKRRNGEDLSQDKEFLAEVLRLRSSDHGFEQVINTLCARLEILSNEAWFKRVWTLQEAVSASQVFLRAGGTHASWNDVSDVSLLPGVFETGQGDVQAFTGTMWSITSLSLNAKQPGASEAAPWTDIFPHLGRVATDDRDYVYGQLGAFNPKVMDFLQPDYSATVESVFISGTLAIIKADENLDTLGICCAGCKPGKYVLPSWCRDWSDGKSGCGIRDDDATLHSFGLYNAASKYKPQITKQVPDTVICVRGVVIDEISTRVFKRSTLRSSVDQEIDFDDAYDQISELFLLPGRFSDEGDRSQALCRTLLHDTFDGNSRADALSISQAVTWLRDHKGAEIGKIREISEENTLRAVSSAKTIISQLSGLIVGSRSLFETVGHRFGRSCNHVQPGDKVCLLYGGHLPFILRKAGMVNLTAENDQLVNAQAYQLIGGESYVDGLVDGEGLEGIAEGDPRVQDICLV